MKSFASYVVRGDGAVWVLTVAANIVHAALIEAASR